jgi:two-component system LytT family sensor kinase
MKQQGLIKDKKAMIWGVPTVAVVMSLVFHWQDDFATQWREWLRGLGFAFLHTTVYWIGIRKIWGHFAHRYQSVSQTHIRLTMLAISILMYSLLATTSIECVTRYLLNIPCGLKDIYTAFFIGLVPVIFVTLIYESVYFYKNWEQNVKQSEALARTNVQNQLDGLKRQLDPHFLFNSLNTLAALIEEDNDPAQKYLSLLADVYRYVLVSREKDTVTLEEEMAFLDAYLYLNKTRFRENLQVEKWVDEKSLQHQVAPMSIQMLVENAIKHNVVSKDKPLTIHISGDEEGLLVSNNIQEKQILETSTKVGLQNIVQRYSLLSESPVKIWKEENLFNVKLPFIHA